MEIEGLNMELGTLLTSLGRVESQVKSGDMAYEQMIATLAKLKDMLAQTNDEAAKDAISKAIATTNTELQQLNQTTSQSKSNFSDFSSTIGSVSEGMSKLGLGNKAITESFGALSTAMKTSTAAGVGLNTILGVISKHPIIAALTILTSILGGIIKSFSQSAEQTNRWKVIMGSFKPVVDAVKNAIAWLGDKTLDLFEWVIKGIPKVVKGVGSGVKSILNFVATIVDGITYIPTVVVKVQKAIIDTVMKGISWLADKLGTVFDALGIDLDVRKITANATAAIDGFANAVINGLSGAGDVVRKWGSTVEKTFNNLSKLTANSIKEGQARAKAEVETENTIADARVESAKRQKEAAELLDKANKATGAERKKLLEERKKLLEADVEANKKALKARVDYLEAEHKKNPTSLKDLQELRDAKTALYNAEQQGVTAIAAVDKKLTTLNKTVGKSKNEVEAYNKELEKTSKSALSNLTQALTDSTKALSTKIGGMSEEKGVKSALGQWTAADERKLQEDIYNAKLAGLKEQEKLIQDAIKNGNLTNNDIETAQRKHQDILDQITKLGADYRVTETKIAVQQIKETLSDANKAIEQTQQQANQQTLNKYNQQRNDLLNQYQQGAIDKKTFDDQLTQLDKQKNEDLDANETEANQQRLDALKQYFVDVSGIYGENSPQALAAHAAYETALTDITKKETDKRIKKANQEANDKKAKQEEQINSAVKAAKAFSSLANTIGKAWEDSLNARLEAGEISQEEAEAEFERLKALQIATTTIDMISGAVGAYFQDMKAYPSPWNAIMAGIDMATVTATGIAQIAAIKRQTLNSSGEGGGAVPIVTGAATPILNEAADVQGLQNVNVVQPDSAAQQDQRVYILQSDITESNKQVNIRQTNSTF